MHKLVFLFTAVILAIGAFVVAPSMGAKVSPLDKVYNKKSLSQDLLNIRASGELSDKQCHELSRYIGIAQVSNVNEPVAGRTYRQLYKQAQAFNPKKYESPLESTPPPFVKPK